MAKWPKGIGVTWSVFDRALNAANYHEINYIGNVVFLITFKIQAAAVHNERSNPIGLSHMIKVQG